MVLICAGWCILSNAKHAVNVFLGLTDYSIDSENLSDYRLYVCDIDYSKRHIYFSSMQTANKVSDSFDH